MDFYEVIRRRRAIRNYKPDAVPKEVLMRILDAANWAPSGMNLQQWEFIVVSGDKKNELAQSYGRVAEGYTAGWKDVKQREIFLQYARSFGGAPVIIVALTRASSNQGTVKMHLESVSAAFENLLLAACAEGLGSCWMTGPMQDEGSLRRILDIPVEKEIVAVTPIGYPEKYPPAPARIDPDLSQKVIWAE